MRIPFNDVTEIGVVEFLNMMSYIKDKDLNEREEWEKQRKKSSR